MYRQCLREAVSRTVSRKIPRQAMREGVSYLLRHITKADVEGSATLDFVAGGVELEGLFMIGILCSELTPNSGDAAGAVAAFDFFFVMLNASNNVLGATRLLYWSHNVSTQSCPSRETPSTIPSAVFRGAMVSVGHVRELGMVCVVETSTVFKQCSRCLSTLD
jgi:hypothetical protein